MALLGIGTFTQVKSISDAMELSFNVPPIVTAVLLTITVGLLQLAGLKELRM